MIREDYIMRLIKQLAAFVGRIAGYTKRGDYDAALESSRRAWDEVLDVPRDLVDRIDAPTLARMLAEPARMRAGSERLVEEARAYAGKQDLMHATLCYRRAFELRLEARAIEPKDDDDTALFELARHVPPGEIHERYRAG